MRFRSNHWVFIALLAAGCSGEGNNKIFDPTQGITATSEIDSKSAAAANQEALAAKNRARDPFFDVDPSQLPTFDQCAEKYVEGCERIKGYYELAGGTKQTVYDFQLRGVETETLSSKLFANYGNSSRYINPYFNLYSAPADVMTRNRLIPSMMGQGGMINFRSNLFRGTPQLSQYYCDGQYRMDPCGSMDTQQYLTSRTMMSCLDDVAYHLERNDIPAARQAYYPLQQPQYSGYLKKNFSQGFTQPFSEMGEMFKQQWSAAGHRMVQAGVGIAAGIVSGASNYAAFTAESMLGRIGQMAGGLNMFGQIGGHANFGGMTPLDMCNQRQGLTQVQIQCCHEIRYCL